MKKLIALLLVLVMLFAITGCAKKGDCEMCKEKDVELKTVEVDGKEADVCEDCAKIVEGLNELADALK